jgi:hypothetical protein
MNIDVLFSYLLSLSWLYLTSWGVALVVACIAEFRNDQP